jgi:DNA-binding NtrC family response regulator
VSAASDPCEIGYKAAKEESLRRFHEEYLGKILSATQGNVTQAARACGMERQALQQIIRRYNINPDRYRTEGSA